MRRMGYCAVVGLWQLKLLGQLDCHLARLADGEREKVVGGRRFNCFICLLAGAVHRCVTCVSSWASLLILLSKLLFKILW